MNERIKQLAEQAHDVEKVWFLPESPQDVDHEGEVKTFNPKKFAELIVAEMCQVMKAEGEKFSLDQNFDAVKGVGRCMRKVKEHFGVINQ